ncbi:MAG TPA: membrane protein insertase YidC [Pseudomonas sp.]|jgi:YidC/Oxa1 family membrane protein insertase|nr:membrane protein insertase YidC [Pseudomonas sp.]
MDIKRSILLVALAVVSYLLVLQWNEDYRQAPQPPAHSSVAATPASDLPDEQPRPAHDDVPVAEQQQPQPNQVADGAAGELIRVRTDVLELAINPVGGDIVQLSLPKYPRHQKNPEVPFQLFDNRGMTYLAQSGLLGEKAPDSASGRARWNAESRHYQLADGQDQLVVDLTHADQGIHYTKRFTLTRGSYDLKVEYLVDNQSDQPWRGTPYAQLKRDNSPDPSSTTATSATYLGAAIWTPEENYKKISMGDLDDKPLRTSVQGGWVAWLQHYFVTAWIPPADSQNSVYGRKDSQGNYIVGFTSQALSVPAGAQGATGMTLYAGPKIQDDLAALAPALDLTVDYGFLWFLAQPIFWLLELIHDVLGNWGWSIVVLTLIIKLIFFPLSAASYKSMARMRAVSPKLQALKEQYGDDRQKMSQAMMELYKKEKINPLGGCLPILVQMPVFLALYWVLLESVEMRQAPWILWITDLSITDPYFILPIVMGLTMFIQQMLNPTPPDPMQARVMKLLPIIFTFFFLWFPAGLVLYWVVNNILSIAQQWYITRQIEAAAK